MNQRPPTRSRHRGLPLMVALLVAASWSPRPATALSLQPVEETFELDGVLFNHWVFPDGPVKITYSPPGNWRLAGTPNAAVLYPPDGTGAEARIEQFPAPKDRSVSKSTLEAMTRALHGTLPPDGANVTDMGGRENPVPIKDVPTGEVLCAYNAYGRRYKKALLIMNHPSYQLSFTLAAPADGFERLHSDWIASLFSWGWQSAR